MSDIVCGFFRRWHARQQPLGPFQVGAVEHLALDADDADAGVFGESINDREGLGERLCGWCERVVDDGDLRRMNCHLGGKAVPPRLLAFRQKAGHVLKFVKTASIGRPRPRSRREASANAPADRARHRRRRRGGSFRSNGRGKVLAAPCSARRRWLAPAKVPSANTPRGVSVAMARMRVEPSASPCTASWTASFAPRWETSDPPSVLGRTMPSRPGGHYAVEIGVDQASRQTIHANEEADEPHCASLARGNRRSPVAPRPFRRAPPNPQDR